MDAWDFFVTHNHILPHRVGSPLQSLHVVSEGHSLIYRHRVCLFVCILKHKSSAELMMFQSRIKKNAQCFGLGYLSSANCTLEHILVCWGWILIQKVALMAFLTFYPSFAGSSLQQDYNLPGGVSNTLPYTAPIESAQFVPRCPRFLQYIL